MRLGRIRILSYKGYSDTGWITLQPGFNVIVGPNNSGKTAFLEALRLHNCPSKPHRDEAIPAGEPLAQTHIDIDIITSYREMRPFILKYTSNQIYIPISKHIHVNDFFEIFKSLPDIVFTVSAYFGSSYIPIKYPSHNLFSSEVPQDSMVLIRDSANNEYIVSSKVSDSANDSITGILHHSVNEKMYIFRAERLNVGRFQAHEEANLNSDASNLPALLHKLFQNPGRYKRFNEHVSDIFPTIKYISLPISSNEFVIKVWSHDLHLEREDLAVELTEGGTGVGQVLAILYVAMTVDQGIIVIDEPNSFLHPGAAKKLIRILKEYYPRHQYIVATHSAEIINAADPNVVLRVTWNGSESSVDEIQREDIDKLKALLIDIGSSLADVMAAEKIIWTEGQTEALCFPIIARHGGRNLPMDLTFIAIRNTGDFDADRVKPGLFFELYRRVSQRNSLLPSHVRFSFDREARSEAEIEDLKRESKGAAHFLQRRTYENYLLNCESIAAVISQELPDLTISAEVVAKWITAYGHGFLSKSGYETYSNEWRRNCDAPKLLGKLFTDVTDARLEYRKTRHSIAITKEILKYNPSDMTEIINYVDRLLDFQ